MKQNLPIIGKVKNISTTNAFLPQKESFQGPNPMTNINEKPSLLVSLVRTAISDKSKTLNTSKIIFKYTKDAAITNMQLLADHNFSIKELLAVEGLTSLSPGSEFRPNSSLFPLFKLHHNAEKLISIASIGVKYEFMKDHKYSESDRLQDLRQAITSNINNKSAIHKPEAVEKAIKKDVERGLSFAIPLAASHELRDKIGFIPLGTAEQWSSDEYGNPRLKIRMTQDCSQERSSGFSINKHIDPNSFECFFGFCLNRVLLKLLALRTKYPNKPIGISKHDLDSAYRRIHVFFDHALLQCWSWNNTAIINFRLPFGSSPAAPEFSFISDFAVDLAQWLCDDPSWNPSSLHCSFGNSLPEAKYTHTNKEQARPLLHNIKVKPINIDGFIDDLITVAILDEENTEKAKHALPLALDAMFRPLSKEDKFERVNILSKEKMIAEGALSERQTVLGWIIDTVTLKAYLPKHKSKRYLNDISSLLEKGYNKNRIKPMDLEKIIGKLVHVSQIAKEGEFFLNRLRDRLKHIQNKDTPIYKHILQKEDINDLHLWIRIIKRCEIEGRSLNRMLDTVPDFGQASDACEHGLGGWLNFGPAWRCQIPDDLIGILSINILESVATYWTVNLCFRMIGSCKILCKVDSMSARCWMRRNRFDPKSSPAHDYICREMGKLLLNSDSAITLQHIQGKSNVLADSLSRDSHLSSSQLTQALNQRIKSRLPENFKIVEQNPPELIQLLKKLASLLPSKTPILKARERSEILHSGPGKLSQSLKENKLTSFSLSHQDKKEFGSAQSFATCTDMETWEANSMIQKSDQEQLEIPSHKLERHAASMVPNPLL